MAEKTYTQTEVRGFSDYVTQFVWTGVTSADTFQPALIPAAALKTVQIGGTLDSATVVIQGSLDGVTYFTLNDLQGSAISKTAAALEGIDEFCLYVKPSASGGGASQSVNVILMIKRLS
jgi:hypothetical protein